MSDLILFDYCYNPSVEKPSVILVEKENYKINIVNGLCKNVDTSRCDNGGVGPDGGPPE